MSDSAIYNWLAEVRDEFANTPVRVLRETVRNYGQLEVSIDGQQFNFSVGIDQSANGELLLVELRKNKLFYGSVHCLGFRLLEDNSIEYLTEEQLWDMGIP
jgi:hypothetical protein